MGAPKGNKYALGNKGGRPRSFKTSELPKLGSDMVDWFETKFDSLKNEFLKKKKNVKNAFTPIVDLPFFSDFAKEVAHVTEDTLINYSKENKEFFGSYQICKDIQKKYVIFAGMNDLSNPTFSIFTAKNITNMRDKQEVEHSGSISLEKLFTHSDGDNQ